MSGEVDIEGVVYELKSYELFEAGVHREGWFTNKNLVEQFQKLAPLVKKLHPNCDILFAFDNSMTHRARPPDGLDATLLPLKDGGKNAPIMRPTKFIKDGEWVEQSLQLENGKPKGLRTILRERGLWRNKMPLQCKACLEKISHSDRRNHANYRDLSTNDPIFTTTCCAVTCLSSQNDFQNQKEWLTEVVEGLGFFIIFYPKFHCELNFIEMIWAMLKAQLRKNCSYNFSTLKQSLPGILEGVGTSAQAIKFARHCFRFMDGYRRGLEGPRLDYVVKTYSRHRSVPENFMTAIQEYEDNVAKKRRVS